MTSIVYYGGQLRTNCTHLQSGQQIITAAPTDNNGKGEAFSCKGEPGNIYHFSD